MTVRNSVSRRAFLARAGALGLVAGVGGWGAPAIGGVAPGAASAGAAPLRSLLDELTHDALGGVAAFVLPGRDRYSAAQGTPGHRPGAIAAGTVDVLVGALDHLVPFADALSRPVAEGFDAALSDPATALPEHLVGLPPRLVSRVDAALAEALAGDGGVPLSLAVALLLNLLATQVRPASVDGRFRAPFARLSFADKARAFELMEGPEADLVAALDTGLPPALAGPLVSLLRTFGALLLELPALGAMGEAQVFDPATRRLTATPVGWSLSGYAGVVAGWDDLAGYYQGRREVRD